MSKAIKTGRISAERQPDGSYRIQPAELFRVYPPETHGNGLDRSEFVERETKESAWPYFACPGVLNGISCGRRVAKIYGAGAYFLCRYCYRLAYASQREDRYDRALRRANKIRMQLGGEPGIGEPFPSRPKGMHHQTYERLKSAVLNAEILTEEQVAIVLTRLQRSDRRSERRMVRRSRKEFWASIPRGFWRSSFSMWG
jgi:hypothetical protein